MDYEFENHRAYAHMNNMNRNDVNNADFFLSSSQIFNNEGDTSFLFDSIDPFYSFNGELSGLGNPPSSDLMLLNSFGSPFLSLPTDFFNPFIQTNSHSSIQSSNEGSEENDDIFGFFDTSHADIDFFIDSSSSDNNFSDFSSNSTDTTTISSVSANSVFTSTPLSSTSPSFASSSTSLPPANTSLPSSLLVPVLGNGCGNVSGYGCVSGKNWKTKANQSKIGKMENLEKQVAKQKRLLKPRIKHINTLRPNRSELNTRFNGQQVCASRECSSFIKEVTAKGIYCSPYCKGREQNLGGGKIAENRKLMDEKRDFIAALWSEERVRKTDVVKERLERQRVGKEKKDKIEINEKKKGRK